MSLSITCTVDHDQDLALAAKNLLEAAGKEGSVTYVHALHEHDDLLVFVDPESLINDDPAPPGEPGFESLSAQRIREICRQGEKGFEIVLIPAATDLCVLPTDPLFSDPNRRPNQVHEFGCRVRTLNRRVSVNSRRLGFFYGDWWAIVDCLDEDAPNVSAQESSTKGGLLKEPNTIEVGFGENMPSADKAWAACRLHKLIGQEIQLHLHDITVSVLEDDNPIDLADDFGEDELLAAARAMQMELIAALAALATYDPSMPSEELTVQQEKIGFGEARFLVYRSPSGRCVVEHRFDGPPYPAVKESDISGNEIAEESADDLDEDNSSGDTENPAGPV
jgi:hypothetical protein